MKVTMVDFKNKTLRLCNKTVVDKYKHMHIQHKV